MLLRAVCLVRAMVAVSVDVDATNANEFCVRCVVGFESRLMQRGLS